MLDTFACPVCGKSDWSQVETFVYARTDRLGGKTFRLAVLWRKAKTAARLLLFARPRRNSATCRSLGEYQFLRRKVLFDVWFPSAETVTLIAVCCSDCSFIAYAPRPSEVEISAKYAYLKEVEPDLGGQTGLDSQARRSDRARASRLFERCSPHLRPGANVKVLDYGGGNGKLLRPFVEAGHSCYIVDYNDNPIPGVIKICDDIGSFPENESFDLIICSHVLEHVSDLRRLVTSLRGHLEPDGLLYAEVPQEIWAGLRLETDPVTHINFFTESSLCRLFSENGFQVLESRKQVATYGKSSLEVLWLQARSLSRGDDANSGQYTNAGGRPIRSPVSRAGANLPHEVKPLLYPSRRATLRRMYELGLRPRFARSGIKS